MLSHELVQAQARGLNDAASSKIRTEKRREAVQVVVLLAVLGMEQVGNMDEPGMKGKRHPRRVRGAPSAISVTSRARSS